MKCLSFVSMWVLFNLINLLRVYRGWGVGAGNEQILFEGAGRVMINILRVPTKYLCGCGAGAGRLLRVQGGCG